MKAIVTVVGKDAVGIIGFVCTLLSQHNINVLDITQTIMSLEHHFTMTLLVDATHADIPFATLAAELEEAGEARNLSIRAQRTDIFNAMHSI